MEHFLSTDIILKIGEYLNDIKDYIYLLQINKYIYQNILENEDIILTSKLFQRIFTILSKNLPKYLFRIENLRLKSTNKDFTLLNEFKFLKCLEMRLQNDFIFNKIPNLEMLYIVNSTLQLNTLLNLKQLKILNLLKCDFKDDCLNELNNLEKLIIRAPKKKISGKCLQNLQNLTTTIYDTNFLQKLINLTELDIQFIESANDKDFFNLQKLKKLSIYGYGQLNNCFKYLNNLEELFCQLNNVVNTKNIKNFINGQLLLKRKKITTTIEISYYLFGKDNNPIKLKLEFENEKITLQEMIQSIEEIIINNNNKN
ncbi:hypothetical protein ABK040_001981 [Willaertia magna]